LKQRERRQSDQQATSTVTQTEFRNDFDPARNAGPDLLKSKNNSKDS
jgi:hypothetical protein